LKFAGKCMKKTESEECPGQEIMFNKYSNSLVGHSGE
jgi:hypothetical protein